jgi:hypothetical protein
MHKTQLHFNTLDFLTGIHRLLLIKEDDLLFPANTIAKVNCKLHRQKQYHCQGQLQTAQTETILVSKNSNLKRAESLYLGFQ